MLSALLGEPTTRESSAVTLSPARGPVSGRDSSVGSLGPGGVSLGLWGAWRGPAACGLERCPSCLVWNGDIIWEGSGCQGWLWGVDPQWWLSFNLMKGNVGFGPLALGIAGSRGHFPRAGVRLGTHIRAPCSWLQAQSSSQDGQRCLSLCPHPAGPPPSTSQLTDWNLGGSGDICAPSRSPCPPAGSNQMLGAAGGCPHGSLQGGIFRAFPPPPPSCLGLSGVRLRAW